MARGGLGARETGARGTLRGPGEGRQAGSVSSVPQGPCRRRQAGEPAQALRTRGRLNARGRPLGGVTGRAGVQAAPAAAAADTSGLASGARHTRVQPSSCARQRRLALMRSSAAPRARPRPPALALPPAGPESLIHFSFSDEDTCWYPPGRSVRWVALGLSFPLPPEALAALGG